MRFERGYAPFVAALVVSAGAHGALVLIADTRAPLEAATVSPAAIHRDGPSPLRLRVGTAASTRPATPTADALAVSRVPRTDPRVVVEASRRGAAIEIPATLPQLTATSAGDSDERVDRPVPLTYPVISLPPDDDPHHLGIVRLMLVVSSEGSVVRSFVIASSLSQDYVERLQRSFEDMRFSPAIAHGMPRAGWYEVAINFEFDPQARNAL